jgi:hypothetical protein
MVMTDMAHRIADVLRVGKLGERRFGHGASKNFFRQGTLFLLSDAARAITGEVLRVDAGQYI